MRYAAMLFFMTLITSAFAQECNKRIDATQDTAETAQAKLDCVSKANNALIDENLALKKELLKYQASVTGSNKNTIVAQKDVIRAQDAVIAAKDETIHAKDQTIKSKEELIQAKAEVAALKNGLADLNGLAKRHGMSIYTTSFDPKQFSVDSCLQKATTVLSSLKATKKSQPDYFVIFSLDDKQIDVHCGSTGVGFVAVAGPDSTELNTVGQTVLRMVF